MQTYDRKRASRLLTLGIWGLLCSCAGHQDKTPATEKTSGAPRIVNIVNFIRQCEPRDARITEDVLYQTVVKQIGLMRQYRLKGTFLLQYDALIDPRYQQLLKSLPVDSFEIGAWWEMPKPFVEDAGLPWRGQGPWDPRADVDFATGYTPAERKKLADTYMQKFKAVFGHYPRSVGSWFIDAYTLRYLYEQYGIVASCNCKDQIGTDGYTLWGGYWNQAYYPSVKNAYMPAQHAKNQIPVPVFRMLGSDPVRQYDDGLGTGRQGVVTLEPVYRFGGGDSAWVHWYFDQFLKGEPLAFAYVQAGQENSFTWSAMSKGLEIQFPLIAKLRDENKLQVQMLDSTGVWFRKNYPLTPATAVTVPQDIDSSDRKTVWFDSRYYRANLLWENGTLRFRDIHLFNEELPSQYLTEKSTSRQSSFFTLPFVDGHIWSSKDQVAGLRLKALTDQKEVALQGSDPKVSSPEKGKLHISWPLTNVKGTLVMDFTEGQIDISLQGNPQLNWFFDLVASSDASLPFTSVGSQEVKARFEDMDYSVRAVKGSFSQPGDSVVLRMLPEENQLSLDLRDGDADK